METAISWAQHSKRRGQIDSPIPLHWTVYRPADWPHVAAVWSSLYQAVAHLSFFLSDIWVGTWLEIFAAHLDVSILVFDTAGHPVGACLLVERLCKRRIVPLRRIFLNAAGEDSGDTTYTEYNDLVCLPGWEDRVAASLSDYLTTIAWDELVLDGFAPGPGYEAIKREFGRLQLSEEWKPCYFVDLAALRTAGTAFETTLGKTRKKHLRWNIRIYSQIGPVRLQAAKNSETLAMFDEMAELNRQRCNRIGIRSVFESALFVAFQRSLISRCLDSHSVQLFRLTAGTKTVGITLVFVDRGKASFYQAGYDYGLDQRLSPGGVTISNVIQYCIDAGLDDWDFLSGDDDYKRYQSTGSRRLVWAVLRKRNARVRLAQMLRAGHHLIHRTGSEPQDGQS